MTTKIISSSSKLLFTMLFCAFFISCTEDNTTEENSIEQLLIENSPWLYSRYELIEILEGEDLGTEFLENDVNNDYLNLEFNFYENNIATLKYPQRDVTTFSWSLSDNTLIGITDPDFDDAFYLQNISVTDSQFTFELGHSTLNENMETETVHLGVFYFN